jgi:uncharacterized membrane protein YfcA
METDLLLLLLGGAAAGAFGALLGLGGGVLIVPLLTIGFNVPLAAAVGTSLISVVATSAGAAALNVRARRADVRLGIALAPGTVLGAAVGGAIAWIFPEYLLTGAFAALMVYIGVVLLRSAGRPSGASDGAPIDPSAPDGPGAPAYRAHRLPLAMGGSLGVGILSSLLGVGGGIVQVPLMRLVMGAPMAVAAATSNYLIGITAAAAAYAYLLRGEVDPGVAGPMVLGVTIGAVSGAWAAPRVRAGWLTLLFVVVIGWIALQMALRALELAT